MIQRVTKTIAASVLGLAGLLASPVEADVELVGVTSATLQWAPASGPVAQYEIYVDLNGAGYPPTGQPTTFTINSVPSIRLDAQPGDSTTSRPTATRQRIHP